MISIKSEREIAKMRASGQILAQILKEMAEMVEPGISTGEIDLYAEKRCKDFKVKPAFKGYQDFPGCVCISVNHEVVHGIPNRKKILKSGDIVGLDFGVILDGWYSDSAKTVPVGNVDEKTKQLIKVTEEGLFLGIKECAAGNRLFDIGHSVQKYVESFGFSVVREFVGHGIGRALHEDPQVPNFGTKGKGLELKTGMVLAIEPMINAGSSSVKVLQDGWTVVTTDGQYSAHFEHTVAITKNGPEILTLLS